MGFRKGKSTEDNVFMLKRMIEMVIVRKECLLVLKKNMDNAFDRENRKFEVMRGLWSASHLVGCDREDL